MTLTKSEFAVKTKNKAIFLFILILRKKLQTQIKSI